MWLGGRCGTLCGARMGRSVVGEFGGVNGCPPHLLPRQNKNQLEREFLDNGENTENIPKREILQNGENPEIRKKENKQKCTKPELYKDPAKRIASQKKKSRTKPRKQIQNKTEAKDLRRGACDLGVMGECDEGDNQQAKAKQLLAVWNGCNMVSCNVVHACGRQ